jgi:hypothetical protein
MPISTYVRSVIGTFFWNESPCSQWICQVRDVSRPISFCMEAELTAPVPHKRIAVQETGAKENVASFKCFRTTVTIILFNSDNFPSGLYAYPEARMATRHRNMSFCNACTQRLWNLSVRRCACFCAYRRSPGYGAAMCICHGTGMWEGQPRQGPLTSCPEHSSTSRSRNCCKFSLMPRNVIYWGFKYGAFLMG